MEEREYLGGEITNIIILPPFFVFGRNSDSQVPSAVFDAKFAGFTNPIRKPKR